MEIAGAVAVVTVVSDVGAAVVDAGRGVTVDTDAVSVSLVAAVAAVAAVVLISGAITAVAVVVVDVLVVTCCDTISDDPSAARLAASLATAGDMR